MSARDKKTQALIAGKLPSESFGRVEEGSKRKRRRFKRQQSAKKACQDDVYSLAEVLKLYTVCEQTVRNWLKAGLSPVANATSLLIAGKALNEFHTQRNQQARKTMRLTQFYCFRCHKPTLPSPGSVQGASGTRQALRIVASCSVCGTSIFRQWSQSAALALAECSELLADADTIDRPSTLHCDNHVSRDDAVQDRGGSGSAVDAGAKPQTCVNLPAVLVKNRQTCATDCDSESQFDSRTISEPTQSPKAPSNTIGSDQLPLLFGFWPDRSKADDQQTQ